MTRDDLITAMAKARHHALGTQQPIEHCTSCPATASQMADAVVASVAEWLGEGGRWATTGAELQRQWREEMGDA